MSLLSASSWNPFIIYEDIFCRLLAQKHWDWEFFLFFFWDEFLRDELNIADDEKMKGERVRFCSMWTIKFDMKKSSIRIGLAFGCYSCSINIWLQSSLSFTLISFNHVIPFWWLTIHSQIQQFLYTIMSTNKIVLLHLL